MPREGSEGGDGVKAPDGRIQEPSQAWVWGETLRHQALVYVNGVGESNGPSLIAVL